MPTIASNKVLNLDINDLSLTKTGLSNFYWPVNPFEISQVYFDVLKNIVATLREALALGLPGVNAGIVLYPHFLSEVMSSYEAHLLISRASHDGYSIISSKQNCWVHPFLNNTYPEPSSILSQLMKAPARPSLSRAPARFVRDMLVSKKEGMIRRSFFPVNYEKDIISTRINKLSILHAKHIEDKVYYKRLHTWFKKPSLNYIPDSKNYIQLIQKLLDGINKSVSQRGEGFSEFINTYFSFWLKKSIPLVDYYYEQLGRNKQRIPKKIWVATAGEVWGKMLGRYLKENQGHVTRYDHGGGGGYFTTSIEQGSYDYEDCDTYVTFSKNQAAAKRAVFTGEEVVQRKCPDIIHLDIDFFTSPILRKQQKHHRKQTVMYVATIYTNGHFHAASRGHMSNHMLLDWKLRLLNKIQGWDYNLILKPHPVESICIGPPKHINGLFGDITLNERFEAVYEQGDIIILDNAQTSLFSTLVLSGKPFVYIDFGMVQFNEYAYSLLKKRCPIVRGYYDEDHRPQIDWGLLHEAIENAGEYSDQSFAEYYFQ